MRHAWLAVLGLGCAMRAPVEVRSTVEAVDQFALTAHGHTFAGLAVVQVDDPDASLSALTPAGIALFDVRLTALDDAQVRSPDPGMTAVLERIPFGRDLALLYRWRCPVSTCVTPYGRLRVDGDQTTWTGRQGRATVQWSETGAELTDPRRGYSLRVVGEGLDD